MKLAHIAIWTTDVDRLASFWTSLFGAVAGAPYHSARRHGFTSRFVRAGNDIVLELMQGPWISPLPREDRAGYAHVALTLGSRAAVDTLAARADAMQILHSPPRLTGDGYYEAVLIDPDGNLVEIVA